MGAESKLRVVIDVSEGTLAGAPAEVSSAMERARRVGWGVAVDNVGADPRGLPLLSVVEPDVIKVDLAALEHQADAHVSLVVNAVLAEAERTGATILAQGIETKHHLALARTMGAEVGQGFLFGLPGPLPDRVAAVPRPLQLMSPSRAPGRSPFDNVAATGARTRPASAAALADLRRHLEQGGRSAGGPALVATVWGDGEEHSGLAPEPSVAVVGNHFAAVLVTRDRGDGLATSDRRFECCVTYDRDVVTEVVRTMCRPADAKGPKVTTAFV